MRRTFAYFIALALLTAPALAVAKKHRAGAAVQHGEAPSARAIGELQGKFKWGMSPDDVTKVIATQIHARTVEALQKEQDVYKQDQLRKDEREQVEKVKASLVKFDGQKSGWDVSIVDKEFAQRNNESMMVQWEKDQRRFLFFWNGKLYKQYIAFNAEHPVFAGKTFDDFAKLIQNRYGQAEMKFAKLRTKEDMTLDYLEWPVSNDNLLRAIDQSSFYGNFCLSLAQASTVKEVVAAREARNPKGSKGNALIDSVTTPDAVKGDVNADIVDQVVGKDKKQK